MSAQKFEIQPYFNVDDDVIMDTRLTGVEDACHDSLQRFGTESVNEHTQIEYVGSDGEDYSGFIALHGIDTPKGASLAVIRSLQFNHATGIPSHRDSWSAEFDDVEVAKDFWEGWKPRFDGMEFVKSAKEYLAAHPDTPRRTVRVQELGMLHAWYDQKGGSAVVLDKFATKGHSLAFTPSKYEPSEEFQVGQVYKVSQQRYVYGPPYDTKTCMAAFVVPAGRQPWGAPPVSDTTVVQWSDGTISTHNEREIAESLRAAPLTEADLN